MKSQTDFQLDTETILPKYIELWIPKTSSDRNSGIILKPFFSLQGCVYLSNGNSQYCLRSKYFHSTQFCCGDVKCALRLPDISSIYNWVMIFLTELWWREQIKWRNVFCLFGFTLPFMHPSLLSSRRKLYQPRKTPSGFQLQSFLVFAGRTLILIINLEKIASLA